MNYPYEARIAKECGEFGLSGDMFLGKKPIYWCCNCNTALAEAEIEYHDHTSPSIYVKFPVKDDIKDLFDAGGETVSVVIWTTTPWTLPANLGVCLHPDFIYAAVKTQNQGILIMAKELVENVMGEFGIEDYAIVAELSAKDLENRNCRHPFYDRESLIILGITSPLRPEPAVFIPPRVTVPTTILQANDMVWNAIRLWKTTVLFPKGLSCLRASLFLRPMPKSIKPWKKKGRCSSRKTCPIPIPTAGAVKSPSFTGPPPSGLSPWTNWSCGKKPLMKSTMSIGFRPGAGAYLFHD